MKIGAYDGEHLTAQARPTETTNPSLLERGFLWTIYGRSLGDDFV